MVKSLISLSIVSTFLLLSCSSPKVEVRAIVEQRKDGSYLIKWETFPVLKTEVAIYQSDNPSDFSEEQLILKHNALEGVARVSPTADISRKYFKLVFNKNTQTIVSNRLINTEHVNNLRDLGGYYTEKNEEVKWGKIYRSGTLQDASDKDLKMLDNLGIKTIIDIRPEDEIKAQPCISLCKTKQFFELPLEGYNISRLYQKIFGGQVWRGDALIMKQDAEVSLIENNKKALKEYFDLLLNENNYPILMFGKYGKDQIGMFSLLTLTALDVYSDQVVQDYMYSNHALDFSKLITCSDTLSVEVQESLTVMLSVQEEEILHVRRYIKNKYGSMDEFFENELDLTPKKREKLKDLLLYERYK